MSRNAKQRSARRPATSGTATVTFLCLTALLLYGMARLIGFAFTKERPSAQGSESGTSSVTATPSAPPSATFDPAQEVSVVYMPTVSPAPVFASPTPSAEETPAPSAVPSPAPVSLMETVQGKFDEKQVDLLCIGTYQDGSLYGLSVAHMRGNRCTIVSIPANLADANGVPLYTAASREELTERLLSVYPVAFPHYFSLDVSGVARCVDTVGGIEIAGHNYLGAAASDYIAAEGSDEMIRISRQQSAMNAFFMKMQKAGLLQLAASKSAIQKCMRSSLSLTQYLQLFQASRQIEPQSVVYRILPVDSAVFEGERCYRSDTKLVNELVSAFFPS